MEIKINSKEALVEKIRGYLLEDFKTSLESLELDEDEKQANIILARKKMLADSENIAGLVYRSYGIE
jgi:hypothetical protein